MAAENSGPLRPMDASQKFVRFQRLTSRGHVEFAFGMGSPDLMVDLVMPLAAYREFCRTNGAKRWLTWA